MTKAVVLQDVYQEPLKKGDKVTIDGYVRGADGRPYAVVIKEDDGTIAMASTTQIRAVGGTY